jgi:arylsulfatase A-like enzyme
VPYEESLRVPLLMAGPGVTSGQRFDSFALKIDVAPTILQAEGLSVPGNMQGMSLMPVLWDANAST